MEINRKYVAVDADDLVWGVGATSEEAIEDARESWGDPYSNPADELTCYPASQKLIDVVERYGGIHAHFCGGIAVYWKSWNKAESETIDEN